MESAFWATMASIRLWNDFELFDYFAAVPSEPGDFSRSFWFVYTSFFGVKERDEFIACRFELASCFGCWHSLAISSLWAYQLGGKERKAVFLLTGEIVIAGIPYYWRIALAFSSCSATWMVLSYEEGLSTTLARGFNWSLFRFLNIPGTPAASLGSLSNTMSEFALLRLALKILKSNMVFRLPSNSYNSEKVNPVDAFRFLVSPPTGVLACGLCFYRLKFRKHWLCPLAIYSRLGGT